jgi:hypothetical protein
MPHPLPPRAGSFGSQENACGFSSRDIGHFSKNFISIDTDHFAGGDVCGRCIRVRGTESGASGNSVLFKIVDECASGCEGHGVDMSTGGLKAVTGFSWDRKGVNWEWASCSEPLVVKSGSSVRWSKSKSKRGRKMMEAEAALN